MKVITGMEAMWVPGLFALAMGALFVGLDYAGNHWSLKRGPILPGAYWDRAKELWRDNHSGGNDMFVGTSGPILVWLGVLGVVISGVGLLLVSIFK